MILSLYFLLIQVTLKRPFPGISDAFVLYYSGKFKAVFFQNFC